MNGKAEILTPVRRTQSLAGSEHQQSQRRDCWRCKVSRGGPPLFHTMSLVYLHFLDSIINSPPPSLFLRIPTRLLGCESGV